MKPDQFLTHYAWNLDYARALTHDVSSERWAQSGGPGLENHPAWTIGHLITGSALVAEDLGVDPEVPAEWTELFLRQGPNDTRRPDEDETRYPSRDVLMSSFEQLHAAVAQAVGEQADKRDWNQPVEWRFDGYLPTVGDTLLFMLVTHEAVHLGQLGCWRRRFDLPSAMAAMGRGPS